MTQTKADHLVVTTAKETLLLLDKLYLLIPELKMTGENTESARSAVKRSLEIIKKTLISIRINRKVHCDI